MPRPSLFVMVVLCVSCVCLMAYGADKNKPLNGEWAVEVLPDAGNTLKQTLQKYNDVIVIKDGKFSTEVNKKYGFEAVEFNANTKGKKSIVNAVLKDEKHGTSAYELTIVGNKIEGKMVWGKQGEDGTQKSAAYTIGGVKKQ